MAGAVRKMAVYLGLAEPNEYYDEYYDEYDTDGVRTDEPQDERSDQLPDARPRGNADHRRDRPAAAPPMSRDEAPVASVSRLPDRAPATQRASFAEISMTSPRTYNEARQIGETFRDGVPVIMILNGMDDMDAKRLVDFAAGLTFGLNGSIERLAGKIFMLTPANVVVTAEDRERLAAGDFYNQS